eukprot:TRINITY_DN11293_c0_g1_i1.p1 TRINITY_DN11293_c0_g1~~TRINITY_DN11293_c0_g1_i1.p1  ORF type:complete len:623 (+),score=174.16 TRINITY_DN11293_c0_g1_i1:56-1924(+)
MTAETQHASEAVKAVRWQNYSECEDEVAGQITEDQEDEIVALSYVFPDLQVRMGDGGVQLQLTDVVLEQHQCKVTITLTLYQGYPDVAPKLDLHSGSIHKSLLLEVVEKVMVHFVEGEPAGHVLIVEAESQLRDMDPGMVASHFVYCARCAMDDVKKGRAKQPQPSPPSCDVCLKCSSRSVVPLPSTFANREEKLCDFCFCEGTPMVALPCGEAVCVECFQRWCDLDIGARKLKVDRLTNYLTIACPSHPDKCLREVTLLKLAAPRTYNQYTRFAFEKGIEVSKAAVCPLPGCTNFPFLAGSRHQYLHCPYCWGWYCTDCNAPVNQCACAGALKKHSEPNAPWSVHKIARAPSRELVKVMDGVDPPSGEVPVRVKYHSGAVDVYAGKEDTALSVMLACASDVFHERTFHGRRDNPWEVGPRKPKWQDGYYYDERDEDPDYGKVLPEHIVLLYNGRILDPWDPLDVLYAGAQLYIILYYPATRRYLEAVQDEEELHLFRRSIAADSNASACCPTADESTKKRRGDFAGKKCPHCTKPVLHYYRHGCHHIGFAGEGCCDKHWCYACGGPHPCNKCPPFCDPQRSCKCPLCPDCTPGSPCPTCTGCPRCQPHGLGESANVFDMFD